jgi:hypothetical protein
VEENYRSLASCWMASYMLKNLWHVLLSLTLFKCTTCRHRVCVCVCMCLCVCVCLSLVTLPPHQSRNKCSRDSGPVHHHGQDCQIGAWRQDVSHNVP